MTTADAAQGAHTGDEEALDRFKLVGTVLEKKFRIERLVAEGGFGVVYRGHHITLERPAAVKVLKTPEEFNDNARATFIEKFALEAKTIARINHANIVQVMDFGVSSMPNGELAPWMVLEWIDGITLEEDLRARRGAGGRSPAETLTLLKPVFEAMAYAHDEGIAHRDIKPANMMIVKGKRGSTLKMLDFGIAKLMEEGEDAGSGQTRTRTTMAAFSPLYAAPEQIGGSRTGPWTDVHALALVVVECLTDRQVYEGEDMTALFSCILSPQRPTPAKFGLDVGPWEQVLRKAMALKPDERFKNAGEFLAALEAATPSAVHKVGSIHGAASTLGATVPALPLAPATPGATTMSASAVSTEVPPSARQGGRGLGVAGVLALFMALGIGSAFALSRRSTIHAGAATPSETQGRAVHESSAPERRVPASSAQSTGAPSLPPLVGASSEAPAPTAPFAPSVPPASSAPNVASTENTNTRAAPRGTGSQGTVASANSTPASTSTLERARHPRRPRTRHVIEIE